MNREEAEEYAKIMSYRDAVYNALQGKCIPYRKATLTKLYELLDVIEPHKSNERMTLKEIISGLKFTVDMFLFDPSTGETYTEPRNDMDKTTIDACKGAIEALERSEKFQQKAEVVISQLRADRDRLYDAIEKIRAEIESHIIDSNGLDFNSALCIAVEIIDKYKTETGS